MYLLILVILNIFFSIQEIDLYFTYPLLFIYYQLPG